VLGGSCRPDKDLLALRRKRFHPSDLHLRSFGDRVAPTPARHLVIEIPPPKYRAGEDVGEIYAVSARDSLHRDFTACALGPGGGN
jgi:hypothetical protein